VRWAKIAAFLSLAAPLAACVGAERGVGRADDLRPSCERPAVFAPAAAANAGSLTLLDLNPFGRAEQGWEIYAPWIAQTASTNCGPATPGFAHALAHWQASHQLTSHGAIDPPTFEALKTAWQARRPFVALRAKDICPAPPVEAELVTAAWDDILEGAKPVRLHPEALRALRRMMAAARRELPALEPDMLKAFSGYRSPDYDAERCTTEGNCDGVVRAQCSAHRTGLAVDLMVGAAQGFSVDSSADANRLFQTRTAAYRWLVRNAARFGFVNYAFEPWHWEWVGARRGRP
jgi:D-alanyl-D-alanine carboxypeptidase